MDESTSKTPAKRSRPVGEGILDDRLMGELLAAFIAELPCRAARIQNALERGDGKEAAHFAHQLKGTAAVYGFDTMADAADRLHALIVGEGRQTEVQAAANELADLCRHVAGTTT
jgi:HPt (histidine-containing phosphotransfer) domain-containing protein